MAFNSEAAAQKLNLKADELERLTTKTAVRLQSAHMFTDALIAVSQAAGCRLDSTALAMVLFGWSQRDSEDAARRYIEDDKARTQFNDTRLELLSLTTDLVAAALRENCGCQQSEVPATLIGLARPSP